MALETLTEGPWEVLEDALGTALGSDRVPLGRECWVLVPGRPLTGQLQRRLLERADAPRTGLRFLSFERLAAALLAAAGHTPPPLLSRIARDLIVREVLELTLREDPAGQATGLAPTPTLADAARRTLFDLREAGIPAGGPARLIPGATGKTRERRAFTAALYERFVRRLEGLQSIDPEGLFRAAAGVLREEGAGSGPHALHVYGFYDLTGGQAALLDAVMDVLPVHQYVPVYPETEAYAHALLERWRGRAARLQTPRVAGDPERDLLGLTALRSVLDRGGGGEGAPPSVTVVSAPGRGREVDTALRLAVRGWHAAPVPLRVALAATVPDRYGRLLAEEVRVLGIGEPDAREAAAGLVRDLALTLLEVMDVASPPVLARLLDLVAAIGGGRPAPLAGERLLRFLAPDGRIAEQVAGLREAARWREEEAERLSAEGGGPDDLRSQVRAARLREGAANLDGAADSLEKIVAAVPGLPVDGQGWEAWARWMEGALSTLPGMASEEGPEDHLHEALETECEELTGLDASGVPADRARVRWALRRRAEEGRGEGPPRLLDRMGVRGTHHDLLVVLGMGESSWPGHPSEDPLLLDGERDRLTDGATWLLPTSAHSARETRLLFRLLLEAGRHVVFLYPRLDESGRVHRASPSILGLLRNLGDPAMTQAGLESLAKEGTRPLGEVGPRSDEMLLGESDRDLEAVGRALDPAATGPGILDALWSSETFAAGWEAEMERWRGGTGPWSGFLKATETRETAARLADVGEGGHVSASLLQEYAICPWRVMARRILGLPDEEEESEGMLDPLEAGDVVHRVVRGVAAAHLREGTWPPTGADAGVGDLSDQVTREVQAAYRRRGVRYPVLEEVDILRITRLLEGWLTWEAEQASEPGAGAWTPRFLEHPFETELEAEGGTVRVRGIYDRVDGRPDGTLRILDYKTGGTTPPKEGALDGGTALQMPLYLLAAGDALAEEGRATEGLFLHMPLTSPGKAPRPLRWQAETVAAGRERILHLIARLLGSMRQGVYPRLPHEKRLDTQTGRCRNCPTPTICAGWPLAEARRHLDAPELADLNRARATDALVDEEASG